MKEIQFKTRMYSGILVFLYSFKTMSISYFIREFRGHDWATFGHKVIQMGHDLIHLGHKVNHLGHKMNRLGHAKSPQNRIGGPKTRKMPFFIPDTPHPPA